MHKLGETITSLTHLKKSILDEDTFLYPKLDMLAILSLSQGDTYKACYFLVSSVGLIVNLDQD